jgi:hypothetical protein
MLELMKDCARPLSGEDIVSFERAVGRVLPAGYAAFLLRYNGGLPSPDSFPIQGMQDNLYGVVQEFLGIDCPIESSNLDWNQQILKGRIPDNLFPIACTPSGDLLCLSLSGDDIGEVVFWDSYKEHSPPTYANVYPVAESFEAFIEKLFRSPESQR